MHFICWHKQSIVHLGQGVNICRQCCVLHWGFPPASLYYTNRITINTKVSGTEILLFELFVLEKPANNQFSYLEF